MPLNIPRIKALCFDIDGTLRDTDDDMIQILSGWLRPFRFIFPGRDPQQFARKTIMSIESPGNYLQGLPDRLGIDGWLDAAVRRLAPRGGSHSDKRYQIISGVQEMLARLRPHYAMSVVSARGSRITMEFLDKFELRQYFEAIATAHTCRHTKPYPDPIIWAAGEMGVSLEACLMVGDTTVDVRAGVAAGAQTAAVLCGFGEEAELRRAGADLILPTTADLQAVLLAKT